MLLHIILSRAKSRDQIPQVILELREEFAEARRQLWNMFDEALLSHDLDTQEKLIRQIERSASEVVPRAFRSHEFWLPIRFGYDLVRALVGWLGAGGVLGAGAADALKATKKTSFVDAGRLLATELANSQSFMAVLGKHFTSSEIAALVKDRRAAGLISGSIYLPD